jgi:hypothetical protein
VPRPAYTLPGRIISIQAGIKQGWAGIAKSELALQPILGGPADQARLGLFPAGPGLRPRLGRRVSPPAGPVNHSRPPRHSVLAPAGPVSRLGRRPGWAPHPAPRPGRYPGWASSACSPGGPPSASARLGRIRRIRPGQDSPPGYPLSDPAGPV